MTQFKAVSWHLFGRTEENDGNFMQSTGLPADFRTGHLTGLEDKVSILLYMDYPRWCSIRNVYSLTTGSLRLSVVWQQVSTWYVGHHPVNYT